MYIAKTISWRTMASNESSSPEDDIIHYLKPGKVAHNAAETVVCSQETVQLNNHIADDDEDLYMGVNDKDFDVELRKTRLSQMMTN